MVISPDGKKAAFVSDVYPQCTTEDCNKKTREAAEKDPVKVRVLTSLPYRHWDEWRTNLRHHIFIANLDTGETRDVTPGDFDSPPHFYEDAGFAFSPDSRSLAFVSNREGKDKEMMGRIRTCGLYPSRAARRRRSRRTLQQIRNRCSLRMEKSWQ
jgi:Tol biopolymer transport system component